MPDQFDIVLVY